jgi:hypothetical protein
MIVKRSRALITPSRPLVTLRYIDRSHVQSAYAKCEEPFNLRQDRIRDTFLDYSGCFILI